MDYQDHGILPIVQTPLTHLFILLIYFIAPLVVSSLDNIILWPPTTGFLMLLLHSRTCKLRACSPNKLLNLTFEHKQQLAQEISHLLFTILQQKVSFKGLWLQAQTAKYGLRFITSIRDIKKEGVCHAQKLASILEESGNLFLILMFLPIYILVRSE